MKRVTEPLSRFSIAFRAGLFESDERLLEQLPLAAEQMPTAVEHVLADVGHGQSRRMFNTPPISTEDCALIVSCEWALTRSDRIALETLARERREWRASCIAPARRDRG